MSFVEVGIAPQGFVLGARLVRRKVKLSSHGGVAVRGKRSKGAPNLGSVSTLFLRYEFTTAARYAAASSVSPLR